jgi:predicted deacylase
MLTPTRAISSEGIVPRYLLEVSLPSLDAAGELQAAGFDVAGVNRAESTAGVVATEEDRKRLEELGYAYTVLRSNLDAIGITALEDYSNPPELSAFLDQVETAYPSLARKILVQDILFEGQQIHAMKVTADVGQENLRPSFLLDAQHHAREVMTPEIARDMIDYLTTRYDTDPEVRRWVDGINIYVVPSVNPDGAMYVFDHDNMWRKNRNPICSVDNNRNYPFLWDGCNGSSGECTDPTYRGTAPASEPETQGMMQFISEVRPLFALSYHSYGEMIAFPYGCSDPNELAAFNAVAQGMNAILENDQGATGQYEVGPIWDSIYEVDGGSIDTQYARYGAYSLTIEVNNSFQPDYATWRDLTVQRQRAAWQYLLDWTLDGAQIRGRVTDAATGLPVLADLDLAEVTFTHGESQRRTKDNGIYHWLVEGGQTYHLTLSAPGYCSLTEEVAVGSGPAVVDVGLVQPVPPASVSAAGNGDNRIDVSWSSALNATGYRVLRSLSSGGPYEEVGRVDAPQTTFQDTTVSGTATYYYVVRSLQPCESGDSDEASASTGGPCTLAPGFGGLVTAASGETSTCSVDLAWPPAEAYCGGPATYTVHRSVSAPFLPSPESVLVSGLSGTAYSDDATLVDGVTYHYIVRALDTASGREEDNTVTLSAAPSGPAELGTWTDDGGDTGEATLALEDPWSLHAAGGKTGPGVYATGTYANETCAALTTPALSVQAGSVLSFASKYSIEGGWDAGIVEVAEGPAFDQWQKLTTVNYPDLLSNTGNACGFPASGPGTVFSWFSPSPSYPPASYSGSLAAYEGQDIQVRWRLSSDTTGTAAGWWVDDIAVTETLVRSACATQGTPNPQEVSPPGFPLWAWPAASGTGVDLAYTPACGALDNAVYWGSGPVLGALSWTEATCGLGNTGSAFFDPGDPSPGGFLYFVVVGQNDETEGSYGKSFDGASDSERPEAIGVGGCDRPQDLTGVCP